MNSRHLHWQYLLLAALAVLVGCGGGDNEAAVAPVPELVSVERDIRPAATDPAITTDLESHVAVNPAPSVTARQKLFVMLPGTAAVPAQYRLILRSGAARGYHALGLNYPNGQAVGLECLVDTDIDCHGKLRRETITGSSFSPHIDVNVPNSLVNRLVKLIAHLDALAPNEGWGRFLVNGQPDWSRITVAGHSQGGGHAGYLGKLFSLDRIVYFASPADWRVLANEPATWVTALAPVTPASRQHGFQHVDDTLVSLDIATANWRALGLEAFGAPVRVDGNTSPYGGSHQLTTAAVPFNGAGAVASPTHGAPVADDSTPRTASGAPLFEPVWAHLCFP